MAVLAGGNVTDATATTHLDGALQCLERLEEIYARLCQVTAPATAITPGSAALLQASVVCARYGAAYNLAKRYVSICVAVLIAGADDRPAVQGSWIFVNEPSRAR